MFRKMRCRRTILLVMLLSAGAAETFEAASR